MGVTTYRATKYIVECDSCGRRERPRDAYSKKQAICFSDMQKVEDGRVLCDRCFNKYIGEVRKENGQAD